MMEQRDNVGPLARPCPFCVAAFQFDTEHCRWAHEHDVSTLATEIARAIQETDPTDEQVGWVMEDAEAIYEDFKRIPKAWKVTEFATNQGEFVAAYKVNGIKYVVEDAEGYCTPMRLSTYRQIQREAGN